MLTFFVIKLKSSKPPIAPKKPAAPSSASKSSSSSSESEEDDESIAGTETTDTTIVNDSELQVLTEAVYRYFIVMNIVSLVV